MRLVIVTGSRAEWGLLEPLAKLIDDRHELSLLVTGSHLSKQHGYTADYINFDYEKIEILLSNDSAVGVSKSVGLCCISFAEAYERIKPDAVIVLGDRYEVFAASVAAHIARIPIIHIHGGETTLGVIDNAFRHSITHMASLHFVAAEPYARKVRELGAKSVFNAGSLGCDGLEFVRDKENYIVAIWHPVTLGDESISELLDALTDIKEKVYIVSPNADPGNYDISESIEEGFILRNTSTKKINSLPRDEFIDLLSRAKCIVGNSSAGIIEAPCLGTPTINVGTRQEGRLKAFSVIDCDCKKESIEEAFRRIEEPEFQAIVRGGQWTQFYEGGNVAEKMLGVIENYLS